MGEAKIAMSASATSAVSRDSSAADGSNRLAACSLRSTTRWVWDPAADSAADRVPATARATPWVRDAGFGFPVTTAIRMTSTSGLDELDGRACAARTVRRHSRYGGRLGGT